MHAPILSSSFIFACTYRALYFLSQSLQQTSAARQANAAQMAAARNRCDYPLVALGIFLNLPVYPLFQHSPPSPFSCYVSQPHTPTSRGSTPSQCCSNGRCPEQVQLPPSCPGQLPQPTSVSSFSTLATLSFFHAMFHSFTPQQVQEARQANAAQMATARNRCD